VNFGSLRWFTALAPLGMIAAACGTSGSGSGSSDGGHDATGAGGSPSVEAGGGGNAGAGGSSTAGAGGSGGAVAGGSGGTGGAGGTGGSVNAGDAGDSGGSGDAGGDGGLTHDGGAGGSSCGGGTPGPVAGTYSIFDGLDLNCWDQASPQLFSVVDGVIDGKGVTGGELLVTDTNRSMPVSVYGNFRIVVSSILVNAGNGGHLGICFWGGSSPLGQYNNCKLIIPPWGDTWDYSLGHGLDGVTGIASSPNQNAATWSTTEILCWLNGLNQKGFCRVAIDGTVVLTYQEPNLASIQAGPIGLQIHTSGGAVEEVQYKDVFLDPAPTVDMLLTVQ
jgi:hypothetical protein